MKDYLANQESFDELLKMMVEYNVFTYGVTKTGKKGYEYSNDFRDFLLMCIDTAKSINFNGDEREIFISSLMTFNKIPFELAKQMSNVIGGRNIIAHKMPERGSEN